MTVLKTVCSGIWQKRRYELFNRIYNNLMFLKDINIWDYIYDNGFQAETIIRDFEKILGRLMNHPYTDLTDEANDPLRTLFGF